MSVEQSGLDCPENCYEPDLIAGTSLEIANSSESLSLICIQI